MIKQPRSGSTYRLSGIIYLFQDGFIEGKLDQNLAPQTQMSWICGIHHHGIHHFLAPFGRIWYALLFQTSFPAHPRCVKKIWWSFWGLAVGQRVLVIEILQRLIELICVYVLNIFLDPKKRLMFFCLSRIHTPCVYPSVYMQWNPWHPPNNGCKKNT